jgi:Tfp pilus assembly protein PilX
MLKQADMIERTIRRRLRKETGSALLASFVLIFLITSAALAALTTTATNQNKSKNVLNQKQAFYLAEASLAHARRALYNQYLANPNVWVTYSTAQPQTLVPSTSLGKGSYSATVQAASGGALMIQATGTAPDNASSTVSSLVVVGVANTTGRAFLADKNLKITGNAIVSDVAGGVHANGNLTITSSPSIQTTATASGTYFAPGPGVPAVGGEKGGLKPKISIVRVIIGNYTGAADYTLSTGSSTKNPITGKKVSTWYYATVQDSRGTDLLPTDGSISTWNCWKWTSGGSGLATWTLTSPCATKLNATLYVNGNVVILANMGDPTDPGNPWITTIISQGSIRVASSILNARPPNQSTEPTLYKSATENILFIAQTDILIEGTANQKFYGITKAREQVGITGNPVYYGYITAQDAANVSLLVGSPTDPGGGSNYVSGALNLSYKGDLQSSVGTVVSQSTLY